LPAGLACGALNEAVAAAPADEAAAFGFLAALTAVAQRTRPGPAVLVAARRALADLGTPCGHGLARLGLDVGRLLLVEAETDRDALWAIEETLRSGARPAMVWGVLAGGIDLTAGRRLNLAAAPQRTPLVLLRPAAVEASAAATRWRIAAAPAGRDRFGLLAHFRWHVALERCRNGRTGAWLLEWDHAACRFLTVEDGLADGPRTPAVALSSAG
jgi:protein ImuA